MSKEILRKRLIRIRKINFSDQRINFIQLKKILNKLNIKKNQNIGGYYPINCEIGSLDVLEKLERNKFKISLPVTKKNNIMDFYEWCFKKPLKVSNRGIPEPSTARKVFPDVLIVPLVGFDRNKFRLGYGGGFYDRYIEKVSKLKKTLNIGIAHSCQKVSKVPLNKYDKKLDIVITEKYILS